MGGSFNVLRPTAISTWRTAFEIDASAAAAAQWAKRVQISTPTL
jgi:hypothetical protein